MNGYIETLKADLNDAIEKQEQEQREEFNAGREDALRYAIEMFEKHEQSNSHKHSVMQGSDFETQTIIDDGTKYSVKPYDPEFIKLTAVGNSAAGQSGSDGVWCKWIREKRCECEADGECTLV